MTAAPGPVDDVADLTPGWLTAALRAGGLDAAVDAVTAERIGHGQMGANFRLRLEGTGDLPSTLVAKLGAGEDRSIVAGGYRKEVAFYRDLAATVAVRHPHCHHVSANDDASVFTLLLADLAPAEVGDQLAGCGPVEARQAVENLAALHGPRWCDPTLWDHPELDPTDQDGAAFLGEVFRSAVATFVDQYRAELGDGDEALLRDVVEVLPTWITGRPERFAMLHGDYRLDNLLFAADGVHAVDWQTVGAGHPGRDLAYFLETSLEPAVRRAHQDELAAAYADALRAHGVDPGDVADDLRWGTLQGPMITVLGAVYATAQPTPRSDAMFLTMLRRSLAAIRDLDPLALL